MQYSPGILYWNGQGLAASLSLERLTTVLMDQRSIPGDARIFTRRLRPSFTETGRSSCHNPQSSEAGAEPEAGVLSMPLCAPGHLEPVIYPARVFRLCCAAAAAAPLTATAAQRPRPAPLLGLPAAQWPVA